MRTKIVPELFLEVAEIKRFEMGLRDDGFVFDKIAETRDWGLIHNLKTDVNFNNFKIIPTGDVDKFRIRNGRAYDKDRLVITYAHENEDIQIPLQNTPYWVKISHQYDSREVGIVKVGSTSNKSIVAGVDTKFTDVLRGQPNFSSKIKFLNSSMYNLEYEVLEVIDDTNILINGVFNVLEENLQYAVVGTFTPGHQPPAENKQIFQYDSVRIDLIEDTNGNFPVLIEGKEFIIGKIQYTSSGTQIQDYRFTCLYASIDKYHVDSISIDDNPLVGIEYLKTFSAGTNNVYLSGIDWKFNILSEVQNNSLGVVSISNGKGGAWDDASPFSNGDFDGWRYYYEDGNYSEIISSVKQGTSSILLYLDVVRIGSGAGICVTPNAEEIEIEAQFLNSSQQPVFSKNYFFGIAQRNPTLHIPPNEVLFNNQRIRLYYTFKNHFRRTEQKPFNESTYYNPGAYNSSGALTNQTSTTTDYDIVFDNTVYLSNSMVPKRIPMPWYPANASDVSTYFNGTGLGIGGEFLGWAICNGNNGTPDLRGRFIVGVTNSLQIPNAPYNNSPETNPTITGNPNYSIASKGGEANHKLIEDELPELNKTVSGEHSHDYTDESPNPTNAGGGEGGGETYSGGWATNHNLKANIETKQTSSVEIELDLSIGGDKAHNNLPPYYALIYVMKIN